MRKIDPVAIAATNPSQAALREDDTPVQLVCLALILAVLMLGCRIASIW
jgi:hypothetical protein